MLHPFVIQLVWPFAGVKGQQARKTNVYKECECPGGADDNAKQFGGPDP